MTGTTPDPDEETLARLHAVGDQIAQALEPSLDIEQRLRRVTRRVDQAIPDDSAQSADESARSEGRQAHQAGRDATVASAGTGGTGELAVREAAALAIGAHGGQREMYGGPYHEHLRAVAEALTQFGPLLEMAGWLHDILEGTAWTADELHEAGVPDRVVEIVERVTQVPGSDYLDSIRLITQDPEATLVKIADNADSIHPERIVGTPDSDTRRRLADFEQARVILWSATTAENVTAIVNRINPRLLERHFPNA
jgi:hypothetical protein